MELLGKIRDAYYDLPVILLTAYDSFKYNLHAMASDQYVVKSGNLAELKEKIIKTLNVVA